MSRIARPGHLVAVDEPAERVLRRLLRRGPYHKSLASRLSAYVERQPKPALLALGLLLIAVVGVADYFADSGVSFLPFYSLPVAFVTWYVGKGPGLLSSLAGSLAWTFCYAATEPADWTTPVPYWNTGTRVGVFLVVSLTLAAMRRALDNEKELARTDPLTRIANSRAYQERAQQTLLYSRRYKRPFTTAYIDVDNFKAVNDHFGHSTGDACLRVVADTICSNIRITDLASRIAGDEFAVLMPETGIDQAHIVMERMREKLLEAMRQNGWPATFSIGVVTYLSAPDSPDDLLKSSDSLMYLVKNNGKNGISYEVCGAPQQPAAGDMRAAS